MAVEMIPWLISTKNIAGPEDRTRDRAQSIFILWGVGCSNSFFKSLVEIPMNKHCRPWSDAVWIWGENAN